MRADEVPSQMPGAGAPPQPSVGRIVHFREFYGDPLLAAIITEVIPAEGDGIGEETLVGLHVFPPDLPSVPISNVIEHRGSGPQPGRTWRWPERV